MPETILCVKDRVGIDEKETIERERESRKRGEMEVGEREGGRVEKEERWR